MYLYELFFELPRITQCFVAVIAILTFLFLIPLYTPRTFALGPTVLTMLGIFGCFVGIAIGLMEFRTNDIQGSVPQLVEGIKTAFWASVAGVGGALLIKTRYLAFGPPKSNVGDTVDGATIDDLAELLSRVHQSLAGKEDSTLLSQFKLFRQESRDGFAELNRSFGDFATKMAASNSEALIDALKEVIRDFNVKISEQFGENFKHLNAAVEQLVTWQESYRLQMSTMIETQTQAASSMTEATKRYSELVENSVEFSNTARALGALLETLKLQREQIHASIETLGHLLKNAGDNLPKIDKQISEMVKQIEAGIRTNSDQVLATVKTVTVSLQTSHSEMKRLLTEVTQEVNRDVNDHIKKLSEQTKEQVTALDKALSTELSKSITTLGQHLTALSHKFVEDYTPLTESLRRLIHITPRA